jgi:hypothetical protein
VPEIRSAVCAAGGSRSRRGGQRDVRYLMEPVGQSMAIGRRMAIYYILSQFSVRRGAGREPRRWVPGCGSPSPPEGSLDVGRLMPASQ